MINDIEYLDQVKKMFISNGEYVFKDIETANRFAKDVLIRAESNYHSEGYYHKYEDFKEFLYTYHVDSIAHWLYQDEYEN